MRKSKIALLAAVATVACLCTPAEARNGYGPGYYAPAYRGAPYRGWGYGYRGGWHSPGYYNNWAAPLALGLGSLALGAALAAPYYYAPPPPAYYYPPPYGAYYAPAPYYWRY
jgi:hypothetical protein